MSYSVTSGVQVGQQLAINKCLGIVDHKVHDDLRHEVPAGLCHNLHVRVHQVPDGLHLPLKLWVHGSQSTRLGLNKLAYSKVYNIEIII